jgi:hypothetical protein
MKRTLLLGSAWAASAAAAVGLGFLAISLVDASASTGDQTAAASLTAVSSGGAPSTATSTGPPAAVPAGQQLTDGGTVYGSCADGVPVLASAPAAGWWLDDSGDAGEVEFENGTLKIQVHVTCVDGAARFSVEGPRADQGSGDDGSAPATATPSSDDGPSTAPGPSTATLDDSDGRSGGGHGADDGPRATAVPSAASAASSADDSSGRGGGGHGSDD